MNLAAKWFWLYEAFETVYLSLLVFIDLFVFLRCLLWAYKICSASADILPGTPQWTQTECCFFVLFRVVVVGLGVISLPPLLHLSVLVAPSTCRPLSVWMQSAYVDRISCILFSVLYLTAWVPCILIYNWYIVKYECRIATGNGVGKLHFVFVGTVKRSVFMARFLSTVTLTSQHAYINCI